jgi:hypothetical protein
VSISFLKSTPRPPLRPLFTFDVRAAPLWVTNAEWVEPAEDEGFESLVDTTSESEQDLVEGEERVQI